MVFWPDPASAPVAVKLDEAAAGALAGIKEMRPLGKDRLEVVFHRDYKVDDGRYNNNGWLQELPDPITKLVWDNVVLLSRKTAQELGVKNSDIVEISLEGRSVRGPIWVQPGMADYSLGWLWVTVGRGRGGWGNTPGLTSIRCAERRRRTWRSARRCGRWGHPIHSPAPKATGHWRAAPDHPRGQPRAIPAAPGLCEAAWASRSCPSRRRFIPTRSTNSRKGAAPMGHVHRPEPCVGCSACMLACQSENNVPIVGKDQVNRGREMHWLRIDRYYAGRPRPRRNLSRRFTRKAGSSSRNGLTTRRW